MVYLTEEDILILTRLAIAQNRESTTPTGKPWPGDWETTSAIMGEIDEFFIERCEEELAYWQDIDGE